MLLTLLGQTMPVFWLGIVLLLVFAVELRWLPTSGRGSPAQLILPALTLSAFSLARVARLTRSSMLEVLGQDYIRTARAKGLLDRVVLLRHGLRNASVSILTVVGLSLSQLIGGTVVTETIFSWPGLGRLTFNVKDDLKRTWARETRLERQDKGFDSPTPQTGGKYAPK